MFIKPFARLCNFAGLEVTKELVFTALLKLFAHAALWQFAVIDTLFKSVSQMKLATQIGLIAFTRVVNTTQD